ncbi:hypothetical protein BpHYR1_050857 [Brachionus plicatilis]|uniref:Uncharacterized protein n=1 Tax=Brachionus plicatilis TaxID=10195 RepID=A0A3M7PVQ1_BRAPC|nr:hypothetical protein BpHYR1_050857 [Brachionus plicatilis]
MFVVSLSTMTMCVLSDPYKKFKPLDFKKNEIRGFKEHFFINEKHLLIRIAHTVTKDDIVHLRIFLTQSRT